MQRRCSIIFTRSAVAKPALESLVMSSSVRGSWSERWNILGSEFESQLITFTVWVCPGKVTIGIGVVTCPEEETSGRLV